MGTLSAVFATARMGSNSLRPPRIRWSSASAMKAASFSSDCRPSSSQLSPFSSLHARSLLERVLVPCADDVSAIVFWCCQKASAKSPPLILISKTPWCTQVGAPRLGLACLLFLHRQAQEDGNLVPRWVSLSQPFSPKRFKCPWTDLGGGETLERQSTAARIPPPHHHGTFSRNWHSISLKFAISIVAR